jgi:hypothetical protein
MTEVTKRSRDMYQQLKLGVAIVASMFVTGVFGVLLILVGTQAGFLTPPLGEYRFGPLEVISLYDRQVCLPNQVCADDPYMLYLGIQTADGTSIGMPVIHRLAQ